VKATKNEGSTSREVDARVGSEVLGRGQLALPHHIGGLRNCCKLPQQSIWIPGVLQVSDQLF